jgi:hypothetical protein
MKDLRVTVSLIEHTLHRATARATVRWGDESATAEVTVDTAEGSDLSRRLRAQGGLGELRLVRVRAQLIERVQDRALHMARDQLIQRALTDEDRDDLRKRGPLEKMRPALEAKTREHHDLWGAVENWKKSQLSGASSVSPRPMVGPLDKRRPS